MWTLTILSVVITIASAADYSAVDPSPASDYVPEEPPISPPLIAFITKLLDALEGSESYSPEPVSVADGYLTEQSYPNGELLKLVNLLLSKPAKYSQKAVVKAYTPGVPGVYGGLNAYALHPSLLPASYKRPPLALLPPYAPHSLNLVYPPALPAYSPPPRPAPKPAFNPAAAYGYPGYPAHPTLGLPPLPLIVLTKELLDSLKTDEYEADPVVEAPAPVYAAKPKKAAVKVVTAIKKTPSYAAAKAKKAVKPYPAAVKVKPVLKVAKPKSYAKPAAVVPTVDDAVYAVAPTDAPVDAYPAVEARAASGGEASDSEVGKASAKKVDSKTQSPEGGESARASPTDHAISSQKTISRTS